MGPHQAYGNIPRSIEFAVDWVANCIEYLQQHGLTRIEAREKGAKEWTEHVHQISEGFLSNEIVSWTSKTFVNGRRADLMPGLLDDGRQQERCGQAEAHRGEV